MTFSLALLWLSLAPPDGEDPLTYWPMRHRVSWSGLGFLAWINDHGQLVPLYVPAPIRKGDFTSGAGPIFIGKGPVGSELLEYRSGRLVPGNLQYDDEATQARLVFVPRIGAPIKSVADDDAKASRAKIFNLPGEFHQPGTKRRGKDSLQDEELKHHFPFQADDAFHAEAAKHSKVYVMCYGSRWYFGTRDARGEFQPDPNLFPRSERPTGERFLDFIPKALEGKEAYEYRSGRLILGRIERVGDAGQRVFIPKLGSKIIAAKSDEVRKDVPVYNQPD